MDLQHRSGSSQRRKAAEWLQEVFILLKRAEAFFPYFSNNYSLSLHIFIEEKKRRICQRLNGTGSVSRTASQDVNHLANHRDPHPSREPHDRSDLLGTIWPVIEFFHQRSSAWELLLLLRRKYPGLRGWEETLRSVTHSFWTESQPALRRRRRGQELHETCDGVTKCHQDGGLNRLELIA